MSNTGKDGKSTGEEAADIAKTPDADTAKSGDAVPEIGGRKGPDPTRFGDWEKNGRCVDF